MLENNITANTSFLSMIKTLLQSIAEISDKNQGFELMERRILELIEAYGKKSQE